MRQPLNFREGARSAGRDLHYATMPVMKLVKSPAPTLLCAALAVLIFFGNAYGSTADVSYIVRPGVVPNVAADNSAIAYFGRISFADPKAPRLWWPGSAIEARFNNEHIIARLGSASNTNEFTVVFDGDIAHARTVVLHQGDDWYQLDDGLSKGSHTVILWLRSETWQPVDFKGFLLDPATGRTRLDRLSTPHRKIEFFGDSITCGYGDEGSSTDQRTDANSNNFLSYGALTARALNAEYRCTARSGIGVLTAWNDDVSQGIIMPTYFDRLDPNVVHSWDFKQWTPDAVVINRGENDSGIFKMKRHPDPGPDVDTAAYRAFVSTIRGVYPKATIFCVLGPMDAVRGPWKDYESTAVQQLVDAGDKNINFLPLDIRKNATLSGPGNHPNLAEHADMAAVLTPFIQDKMGWK